MKRQNDRWTFFDFHTLSSPMSYTHLEKEFFYYNNAFRGNLLHSSFNFLKFCMGAHKPPGSLQHIHNSPFRTSWHPSLSPAFCRWKGRVVFMHKSGVAKVRFNWASIIFRQCISSVFTHLKQKVQKWLTFYQTPCILNTESQMVFPIRRMKRIKQKA